MTQPVQEPSTQRSISRLTWGDNQLFRRPSMAASTDMPWGRISKGFDSSAQSIPNNSLTDVDMNHAYNMEAGDSGNGVLSYDLAANELTMEVPGFYAITGSVLWDVAVTWNFALFLGGDNMSGYQPVQPGYFDAFGATINQGVMTLVHMFPANWTIQLTLYQRSGSAQNLDVAYLEAVFLGSFTGYDFESMDPAA